MKTASNDGVEYILDDHFTKNVAFLVFILLINVISWFQQG